MFKNWIYNTYIELITWTIPACFGSRVLKIRSPDVRTLRPGFKVECMKLPLNNQLKAVTRNYLYEEYFLIKCFLELMDT